MAAALRARGRPVGDATVLAVLDVLRRDVVGAGPLEHLLRAEGVTDVLVNGPDAVYVDRGDGLELTAVTVRRRRRRTTPRAAARGRAPGGGSTTPAPTSTCGSPTAPGSTPCWPRWRGPARRSRCGCRDGAPSPSAELEEAGPLPAEGARLLRLRGRAARWRSWSAAAPGSGKTTLLNASLSAVDPDDRLVLVEDTTELRPDHPHVVGLEARPANVEGVGAVDLRTLVRQALRMRPDRLVVGEVRGAEVVDLLAALNTGHEGGCGTSTPTPRTTCRPGWRGWRWPPGCRWPPRTPR